MRRRSLSVLSCSPRSPPKLPRSGNRPSERTRASWAGNLLVWLIKTLRNGSAINREDERCHPLRVPTGWYLRRAAVQHRASATLVSISDAKERRARGRQHVQVPRDPSHPGSIAELDHRRQAAQEWPCRPGGYRWRFEHGRGFSRQWGWYLPAEHANLPPSDSNLYSRG